MPEKTGTIFDIQKFSIHDGPGIRTTVFLKGCPLKCLWCHNPESKSAEKQIFFSPDKCICCGWCFENCPTGAHIMHESSHQLIRERCRRCGLCASECYSGALEVIGRTATVEEIISVVMQDKPFYETSGGGMTISGGEPMTQFEFTLSLLKGAKKHQLHTCLDTCGYAKTSKYEQVLEMTDIFLFDFKESDSKKHIEFTGVNNQLILNNLRKLDSLGAVCIVRCPIIPGLNDRPDHFKAIAELAESLNNISEINIMPYHGLGKSKSESIGTGYSVECEAFPGKDTVNKWVRAVQKMTDTPVNA